MSKYFNKYFFLFASICVFNAYFNAKYQLQGDEAYYWVLGQNLSLSYYDHPPLVPWLIRLSTNLFGKTEFFVRLPALISFIIMVLYIKKLAKRMFNEEISNIALILALSVPIFEGVSFVITPDSLLLLFWTLTLYCLYIYTFENKNHYLYFSSFYAGLGLLSKYTAILIFPGFFLFLWCAKKKITVSRLLTMFILIGIMFFPVIIWNYQNNWISFKFQMNHGFGNFLKKTNDLSIYKNILNYFGILIIEAFPIICILNFYYLIRYFKKNTKNYKLSFLLWQFIFGALFWGVCGIFTHLEANWCAPIYISVVIFLSYYIYHHKIKFVMSLSVALIIATLFLVKYPLFLFRIFPELHNVSGKERIFYFGTREMMEQVKPILSSSIIFACNYQYTSLASYYLNLKINSVENSHHYQFLNNKNNFDNKNIYFLCDKNYIPEEMIKSNFHMSTLIYQSNFKNPILEKSIYIYELQKNI